MGAMDQTTRSPRIIVNPYVSASGHLQIIAEPLDPDHGGASHCYEIQRPAVPSDQHNDQFTPLCSIDFQRGALGETIANGVSNESLIAVVIDRLQCFNDGPYRCRENSLAITALEEALHWLHHRTMHRQARGVEGKHVV